jgi:MFS family permease
VSFAVSVVLLASIHFGEVPATEPSEGPRSLVKDVREGFDAAGHIPGLRLILIASTAALFCGGLFNVAELLLARDELGTSGSGFSILVAIYGLGFVGGSVAGARGGTVAVLRRRYLAGLLLAAVGTTASGFAPTVVVAALCFIGAGYGAGLLLVHERLLIQALVPDALGARIFGLRDSLTAWAWAVAFVVGPVLLNWAGTRMTVVAAGVGAFAVWLACVWFIRVADRGAARGTAGSAGALGGGDLAWPGRAREEGSDVVGR